MKASGTREPDLGGNARTFRPFRAEETAPPSTTELAQRVVLELERRFPDVLGYLVWSPERLQALNAAVDTVLDGEDWAGEELRPLLHRSVVNQLTGLGPLDNLLLDDTVTEIMVNRPQEVMVERLGRIEAVSSLFVDEAEVLALARRLAARAGRNLNTEHPMTDARLSDGSRITIIIPPVSEHTSITIRRAPERPPSVADLLNQGALTEEAWEFLAEAVQRRRNLVIAGGAGSGKTHLLRLLLTTIGPHERLVVIEDVRELPTDRPGVVGLEAGGRFAVHDLIVQALRMRPDRIVVGEVRAGEALDVIEAMASGHPGSALTVHAPGPGQDVVFRLARAALRSGTPLGFEVVCAQILRALDVIVHLERTRDGRYVAAIDTVREGIITPVFRRLGGRLVRC